MKKSRSKIKFYSQALLIAGSLLLSSPLRANEQIAELARNVSVRIEGATQGSGVVVEREGNLYTVLTAWHVIKGNRSGEEISIYTADGQNHITRLDEAKRINQFDLAEIKFRSGNTYKLAKPGDVTRIRAGGNIYVAGFPNPSPAVPVSVYRFIRGKVIANALGSNIPKGYELLYDNLTLPGMSGGPVLDNKGNLVGIHGQGETDALLSVQSGLAVKTGTNQAIPISYWKNTITNGLKTNADFTEKSLAKAVSLINIPGPYTGGSGGFREPFNGYESEIIDLATQVIKQDPKNDIAYNLRGSALIRKPVDSCTAYAKSSEKWYSDYSKGIENDISIHSKRMTCYEESQSKISQSSQLLKRASGLSDLKVAEILNPLNISTLENLANAHRLLQNNDEALSYYDKLIELDDAYLLTRSRFLLSKFPERQLEGCQDLYEAAYLGDSYAIIQASEIQIVDYRTSSVCKEHELQIDSGRLGISLLNLNKKIDAWEIANGFSSSDEAEKAISNLTNNEIDSRLRQLKKDASHYVYLRFARGAIKQLLGLDKGMCHDLASHIGWGRGGLMWIKYKWSYFRGVCGEDAYEKYEI